MLHIECDCVYPNTLIRKCHLTSFVPCLDIIQVTSLTIQHAITLLLVIVFVVHHSRYGLSQEFSVRFPRGHTSIRLLLGDI